MDESSQLGATDSQTGDDKGKGISRLREHSLSKSRCSKYYFALAETRETEDKDNQRRISTARKHHGRKRRLSKRKAELGQSTPPEHGRPRSQSKCTSSGPASQVTYQDVELVPVEIKYSFSKTSADKTHGAYPSHPPEVDRTDDEIVYKLSKHKDRFPHHTTSGRDKAASQHPGSEQTKESPDRNTSHRRKNNAERKTSTKQRQSTVQKLSTHCARNSSDYKKPTDEPSETNAQDKSDSEVFTESEEEFKRTRTVRTKLQKRKGGPGNRNRRSSKQAAAQQHGKQKLGTEYYYDDFSRHSPSMSVLDQTERSYDGTLTFPVGTPSVSWRKALSSLTGKEPDTEHNKQNTRKGTKLQRTSTKYHPEKCKKTNISVGVKSITNLLPKVTLLNTKNQDISESKLDFVKTNQQISQLRITDVEERLSRVFSFEPFIPASFMTLHKTESHKAKVAFGSCIPESVMTSPKTESSKTMVSFGSYVPASFMTSHKTESHKTNLFRIKSMTKIRSGLIFRRTLAVNKETSHGLAQHMNDDKFNRRLLDFPSYKVHNMLPFNFTVIGEKIGEKRELCGLSNCKVPKLEAKKKHATLANRVKYSQKVPLLPCRRQFPELKLDHLLESKSQFAELKLDHLLESKSQFPELKLDHLLESKRQLPEMKLDHLLDSTRTLLEPNLDTKTQSFVATDHIEQQTENAGKYRNLWMYHTKDMIITQKVANAFKSSAATTMTVGSSSTTTLIVSRPLIVMDASIYHRDRNLPRHILDYEDPNTTGGCGYCRKHNFQFLLDLYDILKYTQKYVCPSCCLSSHSTKVDTLLLSLNYLSHVGLECTCLQVYDMGACYDFRSLLTKRLGYIVDVFRWHFTFSPFLARGGSLEMQMWPLIIPYRPLSKGKTYKMKIVVGSWGVQKPLGVTLFFHKQVHVTSES